MADETQQNQQEPKSHRITEHVPMLVKVLEVILAIFAIGLVVDPMNSFQQIFNKPRLKLDDAAIIYITLAGYVLINTLFITCHVLGDRIPKRTLILFASVGALLHLVAGSVLVHNWRTIPGPYFHNNELYPSKQYMDMLISGAVFTFVDVVAFTAEALLLMRYSTSN